jgi:hypothetical protein
MKTSLTFHGTNARARSAGLDTRDAAVLENCATIILSRRPRDVRHPNMRRAEIQLYKLGAICHDCGPMRKKSLPFLFFALLLGGCATDVRFTNLTPSVQPRTTNNLYTVEVLLETHQQAFRWDTVRPQITTGSEYYKMHRTPFITNRWEGSIPIPPGSSTVHYHYKFDFEYNAFGPPKQDSAISREYVLRIVEPIP